MSNIKFVHRRSMKLTPIQKLKLRLTGHVKVCRRDLRGHGKLDFYAFNCPQHGIVVAYPAGNAHVLQCRICRLIELEAFEARNL